MKIDISIIICTYNRCQVLKNTLASFLNQNLNVKFGYEIIVIDNNSTDQTSLIVESMAKLYQGQLSYIFEQKQGLSYARNKGISKAKGEIIAFIDDDVELSPDWLIQLHKAFKVYNPDMLGGKVLLAENVNLPVWLSEKVKSFALASFDIGNKVIVADSLYTGNIGIGANIAFKKKIFDQVGLFDVDLGRKGKKLLMGEEIDLYNRIRQAGGKCVYCPDVWLYHCIDANKIKKSYVRSWYFRLGEFEYYNDLKKKIINSRIPRWKFRQGIKHFQLLLISIYKKDRTLAFYHQVQIIFFVGYLSERIKYFLKNPFKKLVKSVPEDILKKTVIIIPDYIPWILGTWAQNIHALYSQDYNIIIFPSSEIDENGGLFVSLLKKADIVHCLYEHDYLKVSQLAQRNNCNHVELISSIHHIEEFSDISACTQAKKIMVVCKKYHDELVKNGVAKEKIQIVHNGVDVDFYSPMDQAKSRKKLGIPEDGFTIGFAAKKTSDTSNRKGADTFLNVIEKLSKTTESNINVVITGPGWKELLDSFKLNNVRIFYFNYLPLKDMPHFYNSLDVYLITSRIEGGPVPLLEAMSCETAVITTPVGLVDEYILNEVNGLIVPINGVQAIVNSIMRLRNNSNLLNKIEKQSRITVRNYLSWQKSLQDIKQLYAFNEATSNHSSFDMSPEELAQLNNRLISKDLKRWEHIIDKGSQNGGLNKKLIKAFLPLYSVIPDSVKDYYRKLKYGHNSYNNI